MVFNPKIFYAPEGEDGGTATAEETAPAETTEETSTPAADSTPGLLGDSVSTSTEETTTEPEPSPTPTPGEIAKRPDNVPKQFWNETTGTLNQDGLAKGYNDLRKEFNKLTQEKGKAPDTPEGYLEDFKPPHRRRATGEEKEGEEFTRFGELEAGAPIFVAMSKAAKNANLSTGQFNDMMQDVMEDLHEILPEPLNVEKEKAILGENAENIIKVNGDWTSSLVSRGILNEDEFNLLLGFGSTALGVQLVNKLRLNSGEKPIPVNLNGGANSGTKTPDECNAMLDDPRYRQEDSSGQAYRKEVEDSFAKTFGTGFEG